MKFRYLVLPIALFQMASLFGANRAAASTSAAADVKQNAARAAATPPAHKIAALPTITEETDTKATQAAASAPNSK